MGILLLVTYLVPYIGWGVWDMVCFSALFLFGIFGIYPRFSFFRLGCAFFGGYFLLQSGGLIPPVLQMGLAVPIVVLTFGLSLLRDAFQKPKGSSVHWTRRGNKNHKSTYDVTGDRFSSSTSFGEDDRLVCLPRLSGGSASVNFGDLTVDLSGCGEIADGCHLELNCSFGELELRVPKKYRIECSGSSAFASVDISGEPAPDAEAVIYVDGKASFGEIEIKYI